VEASPTLVPVHEPSSAEAVVLVLHGGASRGDGVRVSPGQLSVVRMIPTARACAAAARGRLAVYRLLNTFRGWDSTHTPVADCDWAIEEVSARYPAAPVGLVGHSLGGRAALVSGDNPAVGSVAVLNPWLYPDDYPDLSGRSVLFVHGGRDRIASIDKSEGVARRLARRTAVGFIRIPDGKHAMLRHGSAFDRYAASFTAAVLLDEPSLARGPVARVLSGESWLTA
jgi:pimeloyl-ACP methyl ester carboxylesterase